MKRPVPRQRPRPDRDDDAPARDRAPCPECGAGMVESDGYFASRESPALDEVVVRLCRGCGLIGACVPRIDTIWRRVSDPGAADSLFADALSGLRERRFLEAGPGDPIFR